MTAKFTPETAQNFSRFSPTNAAVVASSLKCNCLPYEDVFTYDRWQAMGFQVRRGEHGTKISTYAPITRKDENGENKIVGKRPWTSTVFCRCQVDPNGTKAPEVKAPAPEIIPNAPETLGSGEVVVSAKELWEALKKVKITKSSTLPVLNYALLRLTPEGMTVTTTDLEEAKKETVNYNSNGANWATCVPMYNHWTEEVHAGKKRSVTTHPFLDFMRVMADYNETLTMRLDPSVQILHISAGRSKTQFKCIDAQEFPPC